MRYKTLIALQFLMVLYSLGGVLSKLASAQPFGSVFFCVCYGGIMIILGIYALAWQQIIKRIPLTTAFANKAVTVVWGLVWGALLFAEPITPGKLAGCGLIVAGVVLYAREEGDG